MSTGGLKAVQTPRDGRQNGRSKWELEVGTAKSKVGTGNWAQGSAPPRQMTEPITWNGKL
jgi:hypothetical protein